MCNLKPDSSATRETITAIITSYVVKGEVHPRIGHEGSEGEQMYSSTLPSTSALDCGGWSTPRSDRITPGKDLVPIG
jgi:hypothetical protein